MSGLVIRDKNGENISYSGTMFEGLEDVGTRHLCVRTGTEEEDIVKYALTSKPLPDKYAALRMRISDGNSGKDAYIGRRYNASRTVSSSTTYTSSRSSQYTTIKTLTSASSSKSASTNSTRSVTQNPIYHGIRLSMLSTSYNQYLTKTGSNSFTGKEDFINISSAYYRIYGDTLRLFTTSNGALSSTNYTTQANGYFSFTATVETRPASNIRQSWVYNRLVKVTETKTSKVSNYTTTTRLITASKSSTINATTSRISNYTSTSSTSSVETYITNNVDL